MKCVYCFGNGGEYGEEGFMEEETALRTVDWLIDNSKDSKQISITFFGGEPLMNFPLIQRVVEYAKKKAKERQKGVRFGITTNATLFNDNVIAYLKENKINPVISFDGYEAVQNVNRPFKGGQGSYKSVVKNIKKLLCVMPQSLCRSTIYGTTSLDKVKETIRRVGFSNYHLFEASPKINEEIKEFSKIHAGLMDFMEKEAKELLISIKNRNVKNMNTRIKSIISDILFKRKRHYGCGAGKGYLSISSSGDFYPCHRFVGTHEMKMGSIHDGRPDRKEYQKGLVTYLHKCSTCWAKYFCGGGCLYLNKATTGAIFEPDNTFCQEQQFLAELGIYVCCELDKSDITFLKDCKKYS